MRRIFLTFLISILTALPAAADVVDVRAAATGNGALLSIDLTNTEKFKTFALEGPSRIVVDLPNAGWAANGLLTKPAGVSRLRHGYFKPDAYRLVFDLNQDAKIVQTDSNPARPGVTSILIEIAFTSPPTASDAAKAPDPEPIGPVPPTIEALSILEQLRAAAPPQPFAPPSIARPGGDARTPAPPLPPRRLTEVATAPVNQAGARPTQTDGTAEANATIAAMAAAAAAGAPIPPRRPLTRTVVIDAGHGGADPGAIGKGGVKEKHVNLAVARAIQSALEGRPGYEVVLTRDRDIFLRLRERVRRGRSAQADLFLSVHADSHPQSNVSGASLYTLSEKASDAEAARLARAENKADLIGGSALRSEPEEVYGILLDLAQRETKNQSSTAADDILFALAADQPLLNRPKRSAGFAVLKAPDVPSILIELGFLSNPADASRLGSKVGRQRIAAAIAEGVVRYFEGANRAPARAQSDAQARLPN